jgi:hypothetical protein
LYPAVAGTFANVRIKGPLENIDFLVECWICHSRDESAVKG